jgi:hypothetical protein
MLMPCSQNEIAVFRYNPQDIRKFARIEAITVGYPNLRLKPDFRIPTASLDVNMWRLGRLAFVREEVVAGY